MQERVILSGNEFERECTRIAERLGVSKAIVKKRARKAFYTIAANPVRWIYLILAWLGTIILRNLFTAVKVDGLDAFSKAAKKSPAVIVPAHRSHLDYIILGVVLYRSHLNAPLVAAGINLAFWPVGFIIRSAGAYFVKRGSRDPIYSLILKRYVTYLIKRGHLQEFFY